MSIKLYQNWRKCDECGGEFIIDCGLETCMHCGTTQRYFDTTIRSYNESYHGKCYNYYAHTTRFMKLLRIYQGRVLISEISEKCWKSVIENCSKPDKIITILKLSPKIIKYYEYVNFISHILFKTKLYLLSDTDENVILLSFKKVLSQCRSLFKRKTYFPYPFIIKKILLHNDLSRTVRQMKCKRRIQQYEEIWENISMNS